MADESLLQVARIAAGELVMGADDGEEDERPVHRIFVDDFAIGKCPLTNAEYAQFVRETGHPSPAVRVHFLPDGGAKSERGKAPVGSYPANAFEIHDVAGNVWEWVSDWYSPTYYERAEYINPQGPQSGVMRIVRGGAWVNADGAISAARTATKFRPTATPTVSVSA
jgi:formylglycine-generating enzyme required for sulfatase activity